MNFSYPSLYVVVLVAVIGATSCQENEPINNGVDIPDLSCVDHDNDGHGANCAGGDDCDDLDGEVWSDCAPDVDRCVVPRSGCPCENPGEEIACKTREPVVSDDGASLCYAGIRACVDGTWTSCENMEAYYPVGMEEQENLPDNGAHRDALLDTDPTDTANGVCDGSCEASCNGFYDCPSGIDIDDFTEEWNIRYDLELNYAADTFQPAIIVDDVDAITGGYVRIFEAICPVDTSPYWWSIAPTVRFPDPEWAELRITASTAQTQAILEACGNADTCGDTANVLACTDASCTVPTRPQDRVLPADGNLENPASWDGDPMNLRFPFLRVFFEFDLGAAGRLTPTPRLEHYFVYYFCEDAS